MTNEEMLGVAEIVERATNRFNEQAARFRERSAAYDRLIADMNADHERKLAEHRAAFGARTEADRRIIEGLRTAADEQVLSVYEVVYVLGCAGETPVQAAKRVVKERDGLLTQVQDMRAEINRLTGHNADAALHDLLRREYDKALTLCETDEQTPAECIGSLNARIDRLQNDARSDARVREELHRINVELRAEVDFLKTLRPKYKVGDKLESYSSAVTIVGVRTVYDCQIDGAEYPVGHSEDELKRRYEQTPKQHPVKVGEWVKRTARPYDDVVIGSIAQVSATNAAKNGYILKDGWRWSFEYCEPCDPPVDHDTPAGKQAAEAAVRDFRMTDIKAGTKLRLCKVPMPDPQLSGQVDFPWNAEWGSVGDVAEVINTLNPASLPAVAVRLESELVVWWPRSCIEIVRKVPQ